MAGEAAAHGVDLLQVVGLLAAGVVAVPIFRKLGMGSILGYLAAGLAVGPFGLGLVHEPEAILHAAEIGVVLFLFIIGLEMEPSRLWSLRKQIFGLGVIQVGLCGLLLTIVGIAIGFPPVVAFVSGMGFVLTSTAIVMQSLEEKGELASASGQKIVSVLLLEDLAIVPLLAIVALLAPSGGDVSMLSRVIAIAIAAGTVLAFVFFGRRILNPAFRLLARSGAREIMTAAALLVVLGAAVLMQAGGLSMAMGAFLAGVLLSTSTFKHQLEADIEPFRGLLLGLFFLAVGMSLDLSVVAQNWQVIAISVACYMVVKAVAIYGIARLLKSSHAEALERSVLMAQGGEFAFVLYTTAATVGIIDAETNAVFTATVIISMVLTPLCTIGLKYVMPKREVSLEGVEVANGLSARILVIGFGRFGQIVAQPLLALKHSISVIDNDVEMIQAAEQFFGFKVYYGDGTRLDILHAAGAAEAEIILICTNGVDTTSRIVELVKSEFPLAKVMVRAYDRGHAIKLVQANVDYHMREMFESALVFGGAVIRELGADEEEIGEVIEGVRRRDAQRFEAQLLGGIQAGRGLLLSNAEDQAREQGASVPEDEDEREPAVPTPS